MLSQVCIASKPLSVVAIQYDNNITIIGAGLSVYYQCCPNSNVHFLVMNFFGLSKRLCFATNCMHALVVSMIWKCVVVAATYTFFYIQE